MAKFIIGRNIWVECESENTRYGFRHLATLYNNYSERGFYKACYYNRTWERFEFESVLEGLYNQAKKNGTLSAYYLGRFKKMIKNGGEKEMRAIKSVAMIASLGNIFCQDQKSKNDWKSRMLKAGLGNQGLIMPDDWESLSETEKETRLNGAISTLGM